MTVHIDPATFFGHFGTLAHGPVLRNKCNQTGDTDLKSVLEAYERFINNALAISCDLYNNESKKQALLEITSHLNTYRNYALPILEQRANSGQENLRSTILEEFFQLLLYPLTKKIREDFSHSLVLGKANSYVSLTFTPKSFAGLFENPKPHIHTKDQDFVLGCSVHLSTYVPNGDDEANLVKEVTNVVVPVVAIECKTYIERNMLDSCAGTAKRLKSAMPYCMYLVIAEYMKMEDAYPELTEIDELFILTRKSNSDRLRNMNEGLPPHEIGQDLVFEIFDMVSKHLSKIWWSPEDALVRGRVIARP